MSFGVLGKISHQWKKNVGLAQDCVIHRTWRWSSLHCLSVFPHSDFFWTIYAPLSKILFRLRLSFHSRSTFLDFSSIDLLIFFLKKNHQCILPRERSLCKSLSEVDAQPASSWRLRLRRMMPATQWFLKGVNVGVFQPLETQSFHIYR